MLHWPRSAVTPTMSDSGGVFARLRAAKVESLIDVLRQEPALRDREMSEFDRMGYLLDRCGMDHGQQRRFVYELQERCRGGFPPGIIHIFEDFNLGTFADHLARTSWGDLSTQPANDGRAIVQGT